MDSSKTGPRQRLLDSAREITYTHGVNVGVDAILEHAGVARRSLYQHFGGKDGLIAEMLKDRSSADLQRYKDALDVGGTDPRERLLALFDAVQKSTSKPGFRGCAYAASELALSDPKHPAHKEIHALKNNLHALLRSEVEKMDLDDPEEIANQLQLLIEGAQMLGVTRPDSVDAGATAKRLAEQILESR